MRAEFATVEEAVEDIRQGRMIVLIDDEDRENEGDLAMAAEKITPEAINFMAKYARGLICLPLTEERCDELHLPLMSPINTSVHGTAFCESHRWPDWRYHRDQRFRPCGHDSDCRRC